jgi:hypothetical protein
MERSLDSDPASGAILLPRQEHRQGPAQSRLEGDIYMLAMLEIAEGPSADP